MNANLIFALGLIMMAIAILAFILLVLMPGKGQKDVLLTGWIATDEDGSPFLYTSRPARKNDYWDTTGTDHQPMIDIEDLRGRMDLPTWADDPVRVELRICRGIDDGPEVPLLDEKTFTEI